MRRVLILAALLLALPARATDYYVSTTGSGTACSSGTPCALSQINSTNLNAGDNVILAAGTYCGTRLTLTSEDSGSSGNPITIRGATGVREDVILSGLSCTDIVDANAVRCDTAGACPVSGTPSNTYRIPFTATPISGQVWETNWTVGRVHTYDTGNRASYDFDDPVPYVSMGSFSAVDGLAGSYMTDGTYIWVHTFDNLDPENAGLDLRYGELSTSDGVLSATDAAWVRYEDFSIMYSNILSYLHNNCDDVVFDNMKWASARAAGFYANASTGGSDRVTVSNSLVSAVHERDGTTSGTKNDGWDSHGNGDCFSATAASGTTPDGWLLDTVDIHSCWNGLKFGRLTNSRLVNMLMEGSVNHMWRMDEGSPSPFTNVVVERSIIINAQESINPRCADPMPKFYRNAIGFTGITNDICAVSGQTFLGNIFGEIHDGNTIPDNVFQWSGSDSGNYRSDYNWFPSDGNDCNWSGDLACGGASCPGTESAFTNACQAASPTPIACDEHSTCNAETVTLSAFTWPLVRRETNYLGDHAVRADFCPTAGSPLIDAGNPDIDGDGTVENGSGGDDECTVAHHCVGSAPDIGPCEYGLDGPTLIDCTAAAIQQAFDDMCPGGGVNYKLDCTGQTITINTTTYNDASREIPDGCDGNTFDFNNNTIEPSDNWINSNECNGSCTQDCDTNDNGIPELQDDCNDATPRFLLISGDSNTIKNGTTRYWGKSFLFNAQAASGANDNTIDNWTCDWPGDDCFNFEGSDTVPARRNLVSDSTVSNVADKAVFMHGRDSGWADANDYDVKLENLTCTNAWVCLRSNADLGYFVATNLTVNESSPVGGLTSCDAAAYFSGTSGFLDVQGGTVTGCTDGFFAGPTAKYKVNGVTFASISNQAVRVDANDSNVSVSNCTFGTGTGIGIASGHSGTVDAGGGSITFPVLGVTSSTGSNDFAACTTGIANSDDATIKAECNTWDDADPSNEVTGSVDYTPIESACAAPATGTIRGATISGGSVR